MVAKFDAKMRLEPGGPGWTDLRKRLDAYITQSDRWFARSAFAGMRGVEAMAKALCPQDTGALRESIQVKFVPHQFLRPASGGFSCIAGGQAARAADAAEYNRQAAVRAGGLSSHRRAATFRVSGGRIGSSNRVSKISLFDFVRKSLAGHEVAGGDLEIGTDLYYAYFVEFGTKYMHARPFMRPAWDSNYRKVIQIILATEIVDYWRSQARDKELPQKMWPARRDSALVTSTQAGQYQVDSHAFGNFNLSM